MDPRPEKDKCNECSRVVTDKSDFRWIELKGINEGIWYPCCQWCRAKETKKTNKGKVLEMIKLKMKWNRDAYEPVNDEVTNNGETVKIGSKVHFTFVHKDNTQNYADLIYKGCSEFEDKTIFHFANDSIKFDLHQSTGTGEEFGWIEKL